MNAPAYNHDYHQSLVYKIMLANKLEGVLTTFDQTLNIIRNVHRLTGGVKQIVYLVGWQYDGHDSKYPAFHEVNQKLKSAEDESARDSLLRLMRQAREFNTFVSLHINLNDAYENSPLWDSYCQEDLLVKNDDGSLFQAGVWGGEQSYLVCHKLEWESGRSKERVDRLLELLPIVESGTIHIDACSPVSSSGHGVTCEEDSGYLLKILKYLISKGVDVTTEWFHPSFAGLVPMVWHLNTEEADRLKYPPSVLCGGGSHWNFRRRPWNPDIYGAGWIRMPGAGCWHERVWGEGYNFQPRPEIPDDFIDQLCLKFLPWYFLNRLEKLRHVHAKDSYEVKYSDEVMARIDSEGENFVLQQKDRILARGTDIFLPALWRERELWAYSRYGMNQEWTLPPDWDGLAALNVAFLSDRETEIRKIDAPNGKLKLNLDAGEAVVLTPV